MPERRDTNLFEILIGQVTQNLEVNIILGKALSVLPETELFEPVRNLLHRRSDLAPSVLDRHFGEFTNSRQNPVGRIDAPHIEQGTLAALDVVGWDRVRI